MIKNLIDKAIGNRQFLMFIVLLIIISFLREWSMDVDLVIGLLFGIMVCSEDRNNSIK